MVGIWLDDDFILGRSKLSEQIALSIALETGISVALHDGQNSWQVLPTGDAREDVDKAELELFLAGDFTTAVALLERKPLFAIVDGDMGDQNYGQEGISGRFVRILEIPYFRLSCERPCIPAELSGIGSFDKGDSGFEQALARLLGEVLT